MRSEPYAIFHMKYGIWHIDSLPGTAKRYCQEIGALSYPTYFISLLSKPVEFEIYIRLVIGNKFCHYAIFPLL